MPRKGTAPQARVNNREGDLSTARAAVQATKSTLSYRRSFRALCSTRGEVEVLNALKEIELETNGSATPRANVPDLHVQLHALAAMHRLNRPVNPFDPDDGMDGSPASSLAAPVRDATTGEDQPLAPAEIFFGPGDWRLVWINADASWNRVEAALKDRGIGLGSKPDSWNAIWGVGNGFRYLILRRGGKSHQGAYGKVFGRRKPRQDFREALQKAFRAARKYRAWLRQYDRYEEHNLGTSP